MTDTTIIIDEEVEQLWRITASLQPIRKRLSKGKDAITQIHQNLPNLPSYRESDRSLTDTYEELIQNTEWLAKEFGTLLQTYKDVNSLIGEIAEKLWNESVMSREDLEALLHLGKEGSYTSSDIFFGHYEDFDRAADQYRNECRNHSDREPLRGAFVNGTNGFSERTANIIDGAKIAIDVVDELHSFMTQVLEPLPPLRLQKAV